jgi:hypothetical protein
VDGGASEADAGDASSPPGGDPAISWGEPHLSVRIRFAAPTVAYAGRCVSEVQTRTCQAGAWSRKFAAESCRVDVIRWLGQ